MSRAAAPGEWTVPAMLAGERLDRALAAELELPRSRVRRWIVDGRIRIGGRAPDKPGELLSAGVIVSWEPPPAVDPRVAPEAGDLPLIHLDDHLIVIDKPAGLVVHPGAGRTSGTLAHRLLARFPEVAGVGGPGRPGIVHRLDRDTTGVLVVARTASAHERLAKAFSERAVSKTYLAVVWGTPAGRAGRIEMPIGRHSVDRKRMAIRPAGRPAATGWRRIAAHGPIALLELDLLTGRTHQIRVHLRAIGHPLVGDPVYGEARHRGLRGPVARRLGEFPRPALHALRLELCHPDGTGQRVFRAPVPDDLERLWLDVTGVEWPTTAR